jgi:hypothetical protein
MVTKDFSRMFVTGSCIISHGVGQDHSQKLCLLLTEIPGCHPCSRLQREVKKDSGNLAIKCELSAAILKVDTF